jgi:WD40 repeat protein
MIFFFFFTSQIFSLPLNIEQLCDPGMLCYQRLDRVYGLAFSADGKQILTGSDDHKIRMFAQPTLYLIAINFVFF